MTIENPQAESEFWRSHYAMEAAEMNANYPQCPGRLGDTLTVIDGASYTWCDICHRLTAVTGWAGELGALLVAAHHPQDPYAVYAAVAAGRQLTADATRLGAGATR